MLFLLALEHSTLSANEKVMLSLEFLNKIYAKELRCDSLNIVKYIEEYIDDCDDQQILITMCKAMNIFHVLIEKLIKKGIEVNSECLLNACKYDTDPNHVKYLLNHKIEPTKEHFNALFRSYKKRNRYSYYGYQPDEQKMRDEYFTPRFNLLVQYGYKIDRDDLENACKMKTTIPNIERFGFKIDNNLLKICAEKNFCPPYDFPGIDKEQYQLKTIIKELLGYFIRIIKIF
jgi:hypothetical protein